MIVPVIVIEIMIVIKTMTLAMLMDMIVIMIMIRSRSRTRIEIRNRIWIRIRINILFSPCIVCTILGVMELDNAIIWTTKFNNNAIDRIFRVDKYYDFTVYL